MRTRTISTTYQISDAVVAPDCSMISGATSSSSVMHATQHITSRTPVWTSNDGGVVHARSCSTRNTKVSKLYRPILVREEVRALDISVDDALVVQVNEAL
jgi:hypothetical protein